jgi:hypothetical protein
MPDPAEQLQQIYVAGFDLKVFDRFPKCVGVVRDNCIALMVPSPDGLQMMGTPGWLMGEAMGVLVEIGGRRVFQAKQEIVEATPERLEALRKFREDLQKLLRRI